MVRRPLAFAGWSVLLLLVLEGGLRLCVGSPKSQFAHPQFGVMHAPHRRVVHSNEGFSVSYSNARGHIDGPVRNSQEGPQTLLLGDSYAEALQVSAEARYASLLEASLGTNVINAGQSGWSPVNHLTYLQHAQDELHPDTVIVQVNDGDLDELFITTGLHLGSSAEGWRVLPEQRSSAYLALRAAMDPLSRHSALAYMAFSRGSRLAAMQKDRLTEKFTGTKAVPTKGANAQIPLQTQAAMQWWAQQIKALRPDTILLYIPAITYTRSACEARLPHIRAFYLKLAAQHDLQIVDPTDALCAAYRSSGQPLHGFDNGHARRGHLNEGGHTVVAAEITRVMRAAAQ